jgi:hypothetical protein
LKVNIIGEIAHFSLWSSQKGFILTRPETFTSPQITIQTTRYPITITLAKTALFIIDGQNFFLSRSLGHNGEGKATPPRLRYLNMLPPLRVKPNPSS